MFAKKYNLALTIQVTLYNLAQGLVDLSGRVTHVPYTTLCIYTKPFDNLVQGVVLLRTKKASKIGILKVHPSTQLVFDLCNR